MTGIRSILSFCIMKKTRRKLTADFKIKVDIEAPKERESIQESAVRLELHPNQILIWKREFLENAHKAFSSDSPGSDQRAKEKEK